MKKNIIWTLIGLVISGAILYPLRKKHRADTKRREEEAMKMADEVAKEAMDEERRHQKAMQDIERKGEQERQEIDKKFREDMNRAIKIIEKATEDYDPAEAKGDVIHCMMKYRDANGVIHEFDAANLKLFCEVMKDRTNTLIFN